MILSSFISLVRKFTGYVYKYKKKVLKFCNLYIPEDSKHRVAPRNIIYYNIDIER